MDTSQWKMKIIILGDDHMTDYEDWDVCMMEEDLDEYFASAAMAGKVRGVMPKHLSKIWRISWDDAKCMIDVTSQNSVRTQDPTLSGNYGTNDCMCQLFVTDKGYVYIVQ